MKAMIFAAGLGTRLQPLTNDTPKALVKIQGKTLLERSILNLKKNGFTDIVINVHHFADQLVKFIEDLKIDGVSITLSDERDELLDTGGGLLKAAPHLTETEAFLVINVDVLTNLNLKELMNIHLKGDALATLVVRKRQSTRYLLFNEENLLYGWENVKTHEKKMSRYENSPLKQLAFSGIQIISSKLLHLIEEKGKFSIIDLYLRLAHSHSIKAFVDNDSAWMDLGKYDQLKEAEAMLEILDTAESTDKTV